MESIKGRVTVRTEDSEPVVRAVVPCGSVADSAALADKLAEAVYEHYRNCGGITSLGKLSAAIASALPSGKQQRYAIALSVLNEFFDTETTGVSWFPNWLEKRLKGADIASHIVKRCAK